MPIQKRYTLFRNECCYETRCGYMRNLGPAAICADGSLYLYREQRWVRPGEWRDLTTNYS